MKQHVPAFQDVHIVLLHIDPSFRVLYSISAFVNVAAGCYGTVWLCDADHVLPKQTYDLPNRGLWTYFYQLLLSIGNSSLYAGRPQIIQ